MNRFRYLAAALLTLAGAACTTPGKQAATVDTAAVFPKDEHSFAVPEKAKVTNVSLDLTPDFATHKLSGTARLTFVKAAGADSIVLDTRDLTIKSVTDAAGQPLAFNMGETKQFLGAPLTIELPQNGDIIVIAYETSPQAGAVQWLDPAQTSGKKLPFLFTQGETTMTRTWVPTQDGPGIRQTYDAAIHTPAGMRAVMSAQHVGVEGEKDAKGLTVFRFKMDKPIPPYLIALAVGDIAFRPIGTMTGVYAEPAVVDKAANEFKEVDQMVAAASKLYGPYRWGRYDILILPPSFPYGGMENPTLTFATPTLLAGDRSLVNVVAHELAHSWSGNLVTNANWNDFWLNEGFTNYIERRIMEELRGKEYADMLLVLGRETLADAVKEAGPTSKDTQLHLDLKGRDADDATSDIAYEKGSAFLQTVESVVGRDRLDKFLRDYFDHFAFQPMTSDRMVAYMEQKLLTPEEVKKIGVDEWVYKPGIPANIVPVHSAAFDAVDSLVAKWKAGAPASAIPASKWSTHEWLHFLGALTDTIPAARLADLDKTFHLSSSGNSEIEFAWLKIAIRNHYEPAFAGLDRFLTSQGRQKFIAPLYTDLSKTDWGKKLAMDIYRRARPTYHPIAVGRVDKILGWNGAK
jgi:aminopeptidase N